MDRRDFLRMGPPRSIESIRGGGGTQTTPTFERRSNTDLTPYSGEWTWKQAAHLLRRTMIGPTESEIRQAVTDGLDATVATLLTPFDPPLDRIEEWAEDSQFQALPDTDGGQTPQEFQQQQFQRRDDLVGWILNSAKNSPVSIQERLRLFWHNHFTTEVLVVRYPELLYEQYKTFKQHMLGNFKDFVYDVTIDLAMLIYLDGIKNFKVGNRDNINENYARELMELYTMGVYDWEGNENYTQMDVIEAARALSGWQYNVNNPRGIVYVDRKAVFKEFWWDYDEKTLMGRTGAWKTPDVIDIIFEERAVEISRFMSEKFYRAFVYDIADQVVVDEMATEFRNANWEIKPILEKLLKSEHFFDDTNIGAMHKSPIEYMIGMIRTNGLSNVPGMDAPPNNRLDRDLGGRLTALGQVPYYPPNVKGWPGGRTWTSTSTLPIKQKFAVDVAGKGIEIAQRTFYQFDPIEFARQFSDPYDIHVLVAEASRLLLNTEPSDDELTLLTDTILDGGKDYEWDLDDPQQRPEERIRKFVSATVQLAKYQLV